MVERKRRDDAEHAPEALGADQQRQQEQQMVIAGENVLEAEPYESDEPARRRRAEIDRRAMRLLAQHVFAAPARRRDRDDGAVMRTEQIGPILFEIESARRARAAQSVVEHDLRLAGCRAANDDAARAARLALDANAYVLPQGFAHVLGLRPISVRGALQQLPGF